MDHADHVALLRPVVGAGERWADIGAGRGAFTLALADLVGETGEVLAIDIDRRALVDLRRSVERRVPHVAVAVLEGDYRLPPVLPTLDGVLMANSLHFAPRSEQVAIVRRLAGALRPGGTFAVVEYDTDRGNAWVPNPFSARQWPEIAADAGLVDPREIGRVPSRFLGAIYSAAASRPR